MPGVVMENVRHIHEQPRDLERSLPFLETPGFQEALARLHFLVENRRHLGVVLGGSGCGKSSLLQQLARQLPGELAQSAYVHLLQPDSHALLWDLAAQLKTNPSYAEPAHVLWRRIVDRIVENRYQQLNTVLLLDDVDLSGGEGQMLALRLLHADLCPESTTTVIIALRPDGLWQLNQRLLEQCDLRVELEPWDEQEVLDYLQHSKTQPRLESAAVQRLHRLSGGIPRRVSRLIELVQLAARDQQLGSVDAETVEALYETLVVQV